MARAMKKSRDKWHDKWRKSSEGPKQHLVGLAVAVARAETMTQLVQEHHGEQNGIRAQRTH